MRKNLVRVLLIIAIILQSFLVYSIFDNRARIYALRESIQLEEENNEKLKKDLDKISKNKRKLKDEIEKEKLKKKKIEEEKKSRLREENSNNKKIVYLTFDDGPSSNTSKILDILKENNINATFFVNGSNTEYCKAIYKRITNEGNAIGNHTYSHNYRYIYRNKENFIKDFYKLQNLIKETTGVEPNILRFPGGSNNTVSHNYGGKKIMKELTRHMDEKNYAYFDWNVDSTDASVPLQDKDKIIDSVLNNSINLNKAIVLMHDSGRKNTTVEALPEIIKELKSMGYEFRTLSPSEFRVVF